MSGWFMLDDTVAASTTVLMNAKTIRQKAKDFILFDNVEVCYNKFTYKYKYKLYQLGK